MISNDEKEKKMNGGERMTLDEDWGMPIGTETKITKIAKKKSTRQKASNEWFFKESISGVVLAQEWIESERGWGTRPDGCSLHKDMDTRNGFIKDYWSTMPDETPDEYSRPEGEPYKLVVPLDTYNQVIGGGNGIRYYSRPQEIGFKADVVCIKRGG